jgi:hypothetical protein
VIEAASGGGLQVSTTSGAAASPVEQLPTSFTRSGRAEGWVVAVELGKGDGLGAITPQAHNVVRLRSCKRVKIGRFIGNLFLIIVNWN